MFYILVHSFSIHFARFWKCLLTVHILIPLHDRRSQQNTIKLFQRKRVFWLPCIKFKFQNNAKHLNNSVVVPLSYLQKSQDFFYQGLCLLDSALTVFGSRHSDVGNVNSYIKPSPGNLQYCFFDNNLFMIRRIASTIQFLCLHGSLCYTYGSSGAHDATPSDYN